MGVFELRQMNRLGTITAVAGILALASMALQWSVLVTVLSISVAVVCGVIVVQQARALRRQLDHGNMAIAAYIRGQQDSRILNIRGLDTFGKLQHRINNLLDIVDLVARGKQAAVDTGEDETYLDKIANANLYKVLQEQAKPPVMEIPAKLDVNPLLSQLEHLRRAAEQIQTVSNDLVSRADQQGVAAAASPKLTAGLRKAIDHTRAAPVVVKNLHAACEKIGGISAMLERLAERSEIMALNMAITAAHSGGDERINGAVSSMRLLSEQTREARDGVTRIADEMYGAAQSALRMMYESANLIHQINQATVPGHEEEPSVFLMEAKQTLAAATQLRQQTDRLDSQLKQLGEAA